MPIYEYTCSKCGHSFEHLVRTLSAPVPACPECGASKPRKELSAFNAGSSTPDPEPCAAGACPAGDADRSPCAGGGCPYSRQ
jgi:putative FmdB family regulatory protein